MVIDHLIHLKREMFYMLAQFHFTPNLLWNHFSGKLNLNKSDYDFILNISEDGWFGNSIGPIQHFSHSIFRSIEEGKDVLRVANNGSRSC